MNSPFRPPTADSDENFLEETLRDLYNADINPAKVIAMRNGTPLIIDWESMNFIYNAGYGSYEIALDIYIVDTQSPAWLEREEYDGQEDWSIKKYPLQLQQNILSLPERKRIFNIQQKTTEKTWLAHPAWMNDEENEEE